MTMRKPIRMQNDMIFVMLESPKTGLEMMEGIFYILWLLTQPPKEKLDLDLFKICGYTLWC